MPPEDITEFLKVSARPRRLPGRAEVQSLLAGTNGTHTLDVLYRNVHVYRREVLYPSVHPLLLLSHFRSQGGSPQDNIHSRSRSRHLGRDNPHGHFPVHPDQFILDNVGPAALWILHQLEHFHGTWLVPPPCCRLVGHVASFAHGRPLAALIAEETADLGHVRHRNRVSAACPAADPAASVHVPHINREQSYRPRNC